MEAITDYTARPDEGEVCTCGRDAVIVFVTQEFGRVAFCGVTQP